MTDTEIRERVLQVFNRERQKPDAEFDESHFLDFLTFPARGKDTIKGTFQGSRKYYRFMDALELDFGVCFTLGDLDKYYSVTTLTKKIKERIETGKGNLLILQQRNQHKDRFLTEAFLILVLSVLFLWLGINWVTIVLTVVFGLIMFWLITAKIYNRKQLKRLNLKILGNEN